MRVFRNALVYASKLGFVLLLICMLGVSISFTVGWLTLETWEARPPREIMLWVLWGMSLLLFCLVAYLPSVSRMERIEFNRHQFNLTVQDFFIAYKALHKADRAGVFALAEQHDDLRTRHAWLKNHPDFEGYSSELLELAAMATLPTAELAQAFSTDRVSKYKSALELAMEILAYRKSEIEGFQAILPQIQQALQQIEEGNDEIRSHAILLLEDGEPALRNLRRMVSKRSEVVTLSPQE